MSIRTSIAWTFSEQLLRYGLRIGASVIIARLLTPDEVGVFALAMSASVILEALRLFGVGSYIVREPQLDAARIRSALGVMLVISWGLGAVVLLGRGWLAGLYARPEIAEVLLLIAWNFFIAPFGATTSALLQREMRFRALHHIGLASSLIGVVISVGLAWAGFSFMALAWGALALTISGLLFSWLAAPEHIVLRPSLRHWRAITRFGGTLSLASLVATGNSEGVKLMLGAIINPATVALFERAVQIPDLFRRGVFAPIGRVLVPAWSAQLRAGRPIDGAAAKLIAANTVIIWPVFLALGLIAVPFITLVFGENWRAAGEILPVILVGQALLATLPQPEQILIPTGRVGELLVIRSAAAVFSLSTAGYGALHGLQGFALSRLFAAAFLCCLVFLALRGPLAWDWRRHGALYLHAALVAGMTALPVVGFLRWTNASLGLGALFALMTVCAATWLTLVIVTCHPLRDEILAALRALRPH